MNVRQGAKALVENNVFINVQKAIMTNLDSEIQGSVVEKGNLVSRPFLLDVTDAEAGDSSRTLRLRSLKSAHPQFLTHTLLPLQAVFKPMLCKSHLSPEAPTNAL